MQEVIAACYDDCEIRRRLDAEHGVLDDAGNSVRVQRITKHLSEALGLNLFASMPH
jgi:hypothetical protein